MTEPEQNSRPAYTTGGLSAAMSVLIFGFGAAAGLLLAFSGFGFLDDSAAIVVTVFLSALFVVALLGLALVLMRRPLWRKLFGVAETQMEMFAAPLARVAESAVERNPAGATMAARELVQLVLARYSWLAARRWIMASLTALIAAMAALAGTALLFKQNQLLAVQSGLLVEQNTKIDLQNALTGQNVQLAEAQRNSALAVEIAQIAGAVGDVATRVRAEQEAATGAPADPYDAMVNVLDTTDLDQGLVLRIVAASRATRPYRFLDIGLSADSDADKSRVAMARRTDLPNTYARLASANGWADPGDGNRLIDRPASPERGQLLQVLLAGGIHNLEVLNRFGLDLSFAYLQAADLILVTAQGGRLSYADFSGSHIVESDFGGAYLENARFIGCRIERTLFSAVQTDRVRVPLRAEDAPFPSFLTGADFSGSALIDDDFSGANLLAANFDGAVLARANFTDAGLNVATFRGAVLLAPILTGAEMKSVDLDGAVVFGADFLSKLAADAAPETFRAEMYQAEPMTMAEVMAINAVYLLWYEEEVTAITGGAPPFRLKRVLPFAD